MKGSRDVVCFLFGVAIGMLCGYQMASTKQFYQAWLSGLGESDASPTPTGVDPVGSKDNNTNSGWHQIDVFYGQRDGMLVTLPPDNNWVSQVGQDKFVHRLLEDMKGGFFVDLASNDATMISNSYSLETFHDWDGLCIEANSKYWARLAFRKCRVIGAVVGHNRMETIDFDFGPKTASMVTYHHEKRLEKGMFGGIVADDMDNKAKHEKDNNVVKRYTVPLLEIFERNNVPKTIDYFSLDVEGAETYIMSAFPFNRYMFRLMSIERPNKDLRAILRTHNYTQIKTLSGFGETVWAHDSEMERIQALPSI